MIRSIPTYFEKTVENHSAYFQQLFRDHYEPLCARAFQMVHDRKASEDIVQDVFLALWERREELDFDRPLLPLLADGSEVLWLWGCGFAEGCAPDEYTHEVLTVRTEKTGEA